MTLESQLEEMGLQPDAVTAVASDIKNIDARSLLHEVLIKGLWRIVIDETDPGQLRKCGGAAVQRLLPRELILTILSTSFARCRSEPFTTFPN